MKPGRSLVRLAILSLIVALLVLGCASIMKGTKQSVTLSSSPSQASVVIKTPGGMTFFEGVTPATVKLPKKNEYIVTVALAGYKDATANITKDGIEGWFWGNILCGGIIGIIVDASNGAMNKLGPDQISVQLMTAALPGQEDALYVIFQALDSNGQLRNLSVPVLKDVPVDFSSAR